MMSRLTDLTPRVDLTQARGTGPVREQRPVYVDLLPPCNNACPAGETVQAWLDRAQAGKYRQAWDVLVRENPMPAVHGQVCYHPCETACNRSQVDAPVSIHAVERFFGDSAIQQGWALPKPAVPTGKKVLVAIGAGIGKRVDIPGGMSKAALADPSAFERVDYIEILQGYQAV